LISDLAEGGDRDQLPQFAELMAAALRRQALGFGRRSGISGRCAANPSPDALFVTRIAEKLTPQRLDLIMAPKTRSPIRNTPLPRAGESLQNRLLEVVTEEALPWFVAATIFVTFAALDWVRLYLSSKPQPLLWSVIAVVVTGIASFKIRRAMKAAKYLRLGRDGERSVAESLQDLVGKGWRVYNDIPADGFNLDHVAIGPNGILAIETKTKSKPVGHDAQIVVSDRGVSIDHGPWDTTGIAQAQRQADWLGKFFHASTSRKFFVRPVLVFPGWFVNETRARKDTWVLNPGQVVNWLRQEDVRLSPEQIALAASALESFVRAQLDRARPT
jgi:hypothetical protein